ncbi:DUF1624 domain-containing protein [Candidatus Peregrinibacteria bacterium]|nr:DUF1624 domain-containing protein [Candidatus Peregrinibacteria bacterium]
MKNRRRFPEIDMWRGTALIGMVVFHFFFILDYFDIINNQMYYGGWLILARFVQYSFLLLVGISLALSFKKNQKANSRKNFYKKQIKRALLIFLLGMMISLVTFIFIPQEYVKFGMLHLIGLSILSLSFIAGRKYLAFVIGIIIITAGFFIKTITTSSIILFNLGFEGINISSIDYFPVFPWLGVVALGIGIGHILYKEFRGKIQIKGTNKSHPLKLISFIGRHTLLVYMVHIPIILIALVSFKIIPLESLL